MSFINIILLFLLIITETCQQTFFKLSGRKNSNKKHLFIFLGIAMYLLYFAIWFRLLKYIPLGVALPIMGINYATIALVGKVLFKENMSLTRWCGILIIILGIVLVGIGGADFL